MKRKARQTGKENKKSQKSTTLGQVLEPCLHAWDEFMFNVDSSMFTVAEEDSGFSPLIWSLAPTARAARNEREAAVGPI
jgi:hypothetical protein